MAGKLLILPLTVLTISTLMVIAECHSAEQYRKPCKDTERSKYRDLELAQSGSIYSDSVVEYPKHHSSLPPPPPSYYRPRPKNGPYRAKHSTHHQLPISYHEKYSRPLYAAKLNRYKKPSKKTYLKKQILKIPVKSRHRIHFRDYPLLQSKYPKYGKSSGYLHLVAPHPYAESYPQVIEVSAQSIPLSLVFRTASSHMNIQQIHHPAPYDHHNKKHSYSVDEPHVVKHTVEKPIYQEIKEVIVPYRKVTQQIQPVQEEVHTQIATNAGSQHQPSIPPPPPAPLPPAPLAYAQPEPVQSLSYPLPSAEPQQQVAQGYNLDQAQYYPHYHQQQQASHPESSGNLITNLASAAITGSSIEGYSGWKPVEQPALSYSPPQPHQAISNSEYNSGALSHGSPLPTYSDVSPQTTLSVDSGYDAHQSLPPPPPTGVSQFSYDSQPQFQASQPSITLSSDSHHSAQPLAQTYHYQTVSHQPGPEIVVSHSGPVPDSYHQHQLQYQPALSPLSYQQSQNDPTYLKADSNMDSGYGSRVTISSGSSDSGSSYNDANLSASASSNTAHTEQSSNQESLSYQPQQPALTSVSVPLPPTDLTNQSLVDTYYSYASMAANHHDFSRLSQYQPSVPQDQYQAQASEQSIVRIPIYQKV